MEIGTPNLIAEENPQNPGDSIMILAIGRVVAVDPGTYTVDIQLIREGLLKSVPVASPWACSIAGFMSLATPTPNPQDPNKLIEDFSGSHRCEVTALVGFINGSIQNPVCLGFLFPQDANLLFHDLRRYAFRHDSGVYETIDIDGNYEFFHPSGTFIRVASSANHEDLTGKDSNQQWTEPTLPSVKINIQHSSGTKITVDENGNLTVDTGSQSITINGDQISIQASGDLTLQPGSSGIVKIDAATLALATETFLTALYDLHTHGNPATTGPPTSSFLSTTNPASKTLKVKAV